MATAAPTQELPLFYSELQPLSSSEQPGYRRLAHPQRSRRRKSAAVARNREEITEVVPIQHQRILAPLALARVLQFRRTIARTRCLYEPNKGTKWMVAPG